MVMEKPGEVAPTALVFGCSTFNAVHVHFQCEQARLVGVRCLVLPTFSSFAKLVKKLQRAV